MKKQILIGNKTFKYKKDALAFFKTILNSYNCGEILNESDYQDVFNLLKLHPNFETKNNKGILGFKVDKVKFNTKCFHIIKDDLSLEVFSYRKCINGSSSLTTRFSKTCRNLIQDGIWQVNNHISVNIQKKDLKIE